MVRRCTVQALVLHWSRWARAGQIVFLCLDGYRKKCDINCLELRVVHLALKYFLPKCITAMFLDNGQHSASGVAFNNRQGGIWRLQKPKSPFYVPINIFSLSEPCMFPSAGLVWQPSPELWNLYGRSAEPANITKLITLSTMHRNGLLFLGVYKFINGESLWTGVQHKMLTV